MLVNTTVFKDERGICASGYSKSVSTESSVFTVDQVLLNQLPLPYCGESPNDIPSKELLHIYDPNYGDLWVDETLATWAQKTNAAYASNPRITRTYDFTVGTDIPAGNKLSSPLIKNVQVNVIVIDSVPATLQDIPYTAVDPAISNNGLLDFTSIGGLSAPSKLSITVTPL